MDIQACPQCASRAIRPPTLSDGMALEGDETRFYVCPDCGYRGMPLLFADAGAYKAFRTGQEGDSDDTDHGRSGPEGPAEEAFAEEVEALNRDQTGGRPIWPWLFVIGAGLMVTVMGLLALEWFFGWTGAEQGPFLPFLFSLTLGGVVAWAVLRIASRALEKPKR